MKNINIDKLGAICAKLNPGDQVASNKINLVSEKYRPILAWLFRTDILREHEVCIAIKTVSNIEDYIAAIAYDCLPINLRELVKEES